MKKENKHISITDKINGIIYFIGSLGMVLTVVCAAFNILSVWFTGIRYSQVDEISLLALIWVVYIGMGLLYYTGQHVTMDFIVNSLRPKGKTISRIINNLLIIFIASITAYYAFELSINSFDKLLTITKIPYFFCDIVVFLGYTHLVILAIIDTVKSIKLLANLTGGEKKT